MIIFSKHLNVDISIPDSFLYDVTAEIDKTLKIFQLSRALSIFRVNNIFLYNDKLLKPKKSDIELLVTILEYLDTPQYLRRRLYPKLDILKHVGKLHPIRSPHHKDRIALRDIRSGEGRVGVIVKSGNNFLVDVGLESLIHYQGYFDQDGKKINVKIMKHKNYLFAVDLKKEDIMEPYWGYTVSHQNELRDILRRYRTPNIILTSKHSKLFHPSNGHLSIMKNSLDITSMLIVFGSPKFGLDKIFAKEKLDISKYQSFNFFPNQGTQTVRLEESIFGVLSILNCFF